MLWEVGGFLWIVFGTVMAFWNKNGESLDGAEDPGKGEPSLLIYGKPVFSIGAGATDLRIWCAGVSAWIAKF